MLESVDVSIMNCLCPGDSKCSLLLAKTDNQNNDIGTHISFDGVLSFLESLDTWDALDKSTQDKLCKVGEILGDIINPAIYKDGRNNISNQYKDMNIDKIQWLEQRNPLLSSFVNHTTAYDISNRNEKKVNAIVYSIEQIYYTRNIKLVTPFAFQRNVVVFSLTNSKLCASLTGCWESSGSYSTVHNYICSPFEQVECPIGHVQCAIDNNQKLGISSGRIMVGSKMPVDICTSISNFQISESTIQKDETLMPCEWQTNDFSELVDQVNAYELKYLDTFRSYRNNIITEYLAKPKLTKKVDICGAQYDKIDIA
ncbi:unnamed protein product [Mytilus coruscus]|uniref:Uncharacterized protein n=1 Tax=Mytilus coruscus TaxID=42192 RepID=A0A6J8BIX5_MYTCO|nr:unnamed protein product [Mytilus coruscus]